MRTGCTVIRAIKVFCAAATHAAAITVLDARTVGSSGCQMFGAHPRPAPPPVGGGACAVTSVPPETNTRSSRCRRTFVVRPCARSSALRSASFSESKPGIECRCAIASVGSERCEQAERRRQKGVGQNPLKWGVMGTWRQVSRSRGHGGSRTMTDNDRQKGVAHNALKSGRPHVPVTVIRPNTQARNVC